MILGSPSKIRLQRKNGSRGKMTGGWPDDNDHDDDDCVDNDHDDDDCDDVMVTLLRFALLFLIFSRELETDFGGNMFSRLLAYPGSDTVTTSVTSSKTSHFSYLAQTTDC